MKSTVEHLSPTRVRINVEVPFDELKPNFDRVYRKLAEQVKIPGFRPGKAPARILDSRLGRGAVLEEVVNEAVPAKYREAVSAEDVRPLNRPELEVTRVEDGVTLTFTAEVDVRPEIVLPAAADISVTVDAVEVADDEVTQQLDQLRVRFATLTAVDRAAAEGDFVVVDLSATVDGKPVEEAATSGLSYQIGAGNMVDGIDEALTGLSAGESASFTTNLVGSEFADKRAEVAVTVTAVKERELPEADDEFAQEASEFDTLDELTADLRDRMGRTKRMQQASQARDKVLATLIERTEVPLPTRVVDAELDVRQHEVFHSFDHDEEKFGEWLTEQGKTRAEFEASAREEAERSVKTQLVLDAVADAEEVKVSETELTQQIVVQAQRYGLTPEEFLQRAQESDQLGVVFADVRRGKALVTVVRQATVTDETGNELDLTEFLGGSESDTDAPESEGTESEGAQSQAAESEGEPASTPSDQPSDESSDQEPDQEPAAAKA